MTFRQVLGDKGFAIFVPVHILLAVLAAGLVLTAGPVAGQETAPASTRPAAEPNAPTEGGTTWLDEVLITATRSEVQSFAAPYTAQKVRTSDFSHHRMPRTATIALRDVPGVTVQKTSNAQGSPYIRGFTGYRTLMMVDGIRLNNSVFRDGPNQYWNLIDSYTIDRLEVVKGPSSVLYGSDAIGGTVNAVLRRPDGYGEGFQGYRQVYGQASTADRTYFGRGEVVATYGSWLGVLLGGTWKDFGDVDGGCDVGVQDYTGYGQCSGDVRVEYHPDADTTLTFAHYQLYEDDAWRSHSTVYGIDWHGAGHGSDQKRVLDEYHSLSYIRYRKDRVSECFDSVELTASFQQLNQVQWRVRGNGVEKRDGFDTETYGLAMQFVSPSQIGQWTYGVEWYHDEVRSFARNYDAGGTLTGVDIQGPVGDDASYDLLGVYVQDVIPICQRVDLTLGGRYTFARADAQKVEDPDTGDRISLSDEWHSVVGSARLSWFVDEQEHWNVFGGVSQGFRAPNLSDLSGSSIAKSGEQEIPSPGLDPEEYLNYEVGVKAKYENVAAQVSYFYTDISDMIVRTPTGTFSTAGDPEVSRQNAGDGHVQGIEVGASWRFHPQWTLFGAVAWVEGEADTYPTSDPVVKREYLSRLMPTTTQIGLRWDHPEGKVWVETACTFAATADLLNTRDMGDTQRIPPGGTPGYTVLDIRGGWKVCESLDVWAGIENVTNADYRTHGSGVNEPGTNFKIGAKWRF